MMCISIIALFASCKPSPETLGKKVGQQACDCQKKYAETQSTIYQEFLNRFDSYGFKTRSEARQKWQDMKDDAQRQFEQCQQGVEQKKQEVRSKFPSRPEDLFNPNDLQKVMRDPKGYTKQVEKKQKEFAKNQEKARKFEEVYNNTVSQCSANSNTFDEQVINAKILSIIPQKPDINKLKQDLVKRRIIEPANGYFGRGWAWQIASVEELKDVRILSDEKQGGDYVLDVYLVLQKEGAGQYEADVKIICVLGNNDDWTIDFIETKNIGIVKTGRYNNCVTTEIKKGWSTSLQFTNSCDVNLIIGGQILSNDGEWSKFSSRVNANSSSSQSYYGKQYKIDFIERQ